VDNAYCLDRIYRFSQAWKRSSQGIVLKRFGPKYIWRLFFGSFSFKKCISKSLKVFWIVLQCPGNLFCESELERSFYRLSTALLYIFFWTFILLTSRLAWFLQCSHSRSLVSRLVKSPRIIVCSFEWTWNGANLRHQQQENMAFSILWCRILFHLKTIEVSHVNHKRFFLDHQIRNVFGIPNWSSMQEACYKWN